VIRPQSFRAYRSADEQAALALINADRITGQPTCTAAMLAEALAGRSAIDSGWWAELESLTTEVLITETNEVAGVVSYARRSRDGTGLVLWLHGREIAEVVDALVLRALNAFHERPVHAFDFATPLGLGLETLPVRHRPVTHAALLGAGFTPRPLWRYMWRPPAG